MPSYRVKVEADATIEEIWLIDTPEGTTLDADEALEIMERPPEAFRVAFLEDRVLGDEHNRSVLKIESL